MIEKLKAIDEDLFIWLNSFHADWLDPIIFQMTETVTWFPFYAILIYLIYRVDKNGIWWTLGGAAITILISDQVTSGLMKPFFERLRPCHDERWDDVIHNYERCGGLFGFVSSHAANTFGIATFLNLKLKGKLPYLKWLFLWAFIISYTRIYLGVHYPFDIFLGALIGLVAGWLTWFLIMKVRLDFLRSFLK